MTSQIVTKPLQITIDRI